MVAVENLLDLEGELYLELREHICQEARDSLDVLPLLINCVSEREKAVCIVVVWRMLDLLGLLHLISRTAR